MLTQMLTLPGVGGAVLLKVACFRPIRRLGGPCPQGDLAFLGRGKAVFRTRLVGGRAPGRVHLPARADVVDSGSCYDFINSSLSPIVLFRRRLSSVADVLKGIRNHGFSNARWQTLMLWWSAVCRQGPTGPIHTLEPWKDWLPPDLHGFYSWVFETLEELSSFNLGSYLLGERPPFSVGRGGCVRTLVLDLTDGSDRT